MNKIQISYDLRAPGREYDTLYAAIKSYGKWCQPLESTWIIITDQTMSQVRDYLRRHVDGNDGLLVTKLSGEMAWYGMGTQVSDWLVAA